MSSIDPELRDLIREEVDNDADFDLIHELIEWENEQLAEIQRNNVTRTIDEMISRRAEND